MLRGQLRGWKSSPLLRILQHMKCISRQIWTTVTLTVITLYTHSVHPLKDKNLFSLVSFCSLALRDSERRNVRPFHR